ncbi:MAG: hypothetical protein E7647_08225 [Ruminococcaceae bacterium]|nr:hypothetical protein [Oscillospiraceae bacterium]
MNFSIEKKGYSIEEVDTFIEDLISKYQRLQAQNTELEQKLATAKRLIRRFSDTENALKQNIADSKRAAAYMISDARDRSAELLDNTRESCGEIISDLDLKIAERMATVDRMKAEVAAFKDEMFALYSSHIEMIDTLAATAEDFEYSPDYTAVADAVDAFEEAGEPECRVPEFVDYPEESIFAELKEEEKAPVSEDFILEVSETAEEDDIVFETEEAVAESEDYSQLVLEEAETEEEEETFDLSADETEQPSPVEEEDDFEVEMSAEEETDYFKFLSDFVNSDEESDS